MFEDDKAFENEVRRIARLLWSTSASGGAEMIDGQERDGIFITSEMVHIIECTTSPSKKKAIEDGRKLAKLVKDMRVQSRYRLKSVKGWFITKNEPTADQRTVIRELDEAVQTLSFEDFKSMIIDAMSYLDLRQRYQFGSMRDPETGKQMNNVDYIQLDMVSDTGQEWNVSTVASALNEGRNFVMLGDYGAGKSTTMREIFFALSKSYRSKHSLRFPILLNLGDHHGQTVPAEALHRHASNIGYSNPEHLVRAWRAGYVTLLLDGFDEIVTPGWFGPVNKLAMRRRESMELVRKFIADTPDGSGIAISGRLHFFDSKVELDSALGIRTESSNGPSYGIVPLFVRLNLDDFTEEQIKEYLQKRGWSQNVIPSWLPSRPLLVGYLAAKRVFEDVVHLGANLSPAEGWDQLLTLISNREAQAEMRVDGETIRRLIERLATKARSSSDGLGPLHNHDIVESFTQVVGYPPDERGITLIQRLPGLGVSKAEDGSRVFLDKDFADAARSGDIYRYIEHPFVKETYIDESRYWRSSLEQLGVEIVTNRCRGNGFTPRKFAAAAEKAAEQSEYGTLCADVIQATNESGYGYDGDRIIIADVVFSEVHFGDQNKDFTKITFQECSFQVLDLDIAADSRVLPVFRKCLFSLVEGRTSKAHLPVDNFIECIVESFSQSAGTNDAIMNLPLPLGNRVLLTVLKKLYQQRGSGRKQSALTRGLDQSARALVPDVLDILRQDNFAIESGASAGKETVWLPVRDRGAQVRSFLETRSPTDTLLQKSSALR